MSKKSKQVLSCSISFFMIFFLVFSGWPKDVKAETNNKYVAIAAGYNHTVALDNNGRVWSWGDNEWGQLGTGNNKNSSIPVQVVGLDNIKITAISAGQGHTIALDSEGKVWSWGDNEWGQLGTGNNKNSSIPVQVAGLDNIEITAISAGQGHTIALDSEGKVWSWGYNYDGELGIGNDINSDIPVQVVGMNNIKITKVSAGGEHTIVLDSEGKVWSWGQNDYGELGIGNDINSNIPVQVIGLHNIKITTISAAQRHTVALDSEGRVWGWGYNEYGELGDGNNSYSNIPLQTVGLNNIKITAISATCYHTVALDSEGKVWDWGYNKYGQLGNGNNGYSNVPTQVVGLDNIKMTAISAGGEHSIALDSKGETWSWGNNDFGQLGTGNNAYSNVPANVNDEDNVSLDKDSLEIGYASGDDSSSVTQNLVLPVKGINGTDIAWASSNTAGISNTGVVTRPDIGSGNENVSLTATITKGAYTSTKNFTVTVLEKPMSITSVSFPQDGIYKVGDNLDFAVNFNGNVKVNSSSGTPYLPITIGDKQVQAHYISGSDTSSLIFRYTIVNGNDSSGISVGNSLNLNGGNIISGDSAGVSCGIAFSGRALASIIIDATPPTFDSSTGAALDNDSKKLTLAFSENIANACANLDDLRSNISFSSDGTGFNALSANDTVAIENGKLVIIFDKLLIGTNNKIKIAANSIKDAAGNIKTDETDINSIQGIPRLIIDTTNPTAGTVNSPYNFNFSSSGGSGSKAYSLEPGSLPSGLALATDGTLSGTPTSSGTFNFKVKVTDASGQSSDHEYTMLVNNQAPPIPPTQAGVTLNLKFTGQNSQSSTVNVTNFNFTSTAASNGLKQYEFDLPENKVIEIESAGIQTNSSSVEIMDGNNNSIGEVEFPSAVILQISILNTVNTMFPVTINGNNNFPTKTYMANLNITTLGNNKHFNVSFTEVSVPSVPTNVRAAAGDGCATVSFTPPSNNGGSPITSYKVISNTGALVGTGTGSPIIVTGLTNGVTYNFKVIATNAEGDSLPSAVSNNITPSAPYVPPYIPPVPQPVTETRTVPVTVKVGNNEFTLGNVIVVRTINVNGTINDMISLDESSLSQIIANALKDNAASLDIILNDSVASAADSIEFQADGNSVKLLQENKLSLNVETAKGGISLPYATLMQLTGTIVQGTFSEISDSRTQSIISEYATGAKQIGDSLKFDTNFSGAAEVMIPITADELQQANGNANFLSNLAVMVQHNDGENEVVTGTIVYDSNNKPVEVKIPVKKFSIFTLIELPNSTNDGDAKVMPYKVNSDKVWTVNFSNNIDKTTVNKDNVYVVDDEGNKVDVKLEVDGKALTISPVENYKSGHKYHLYISDKVQSVNKKTLKKALEYEFNVI